MTIYTAPQNDKDKAKLLPEVIDGSMTSLNMKDDVADTPGPRVVEVTYFRRNGRSFYIHLLFALAVLVILACGALGAVVFYRHLHKKVYAGKCGAVYFDTTYHDNLKVPVAESMLGEKNPSSGQQMDYMEEDISVNKDSMTENLHTKAFDEVRESFVHHSFKLNFTAIVDRTYRQCFIMKLNRSAIAAPGDVIEFLHLTVMSKNFLRRATVIRLDFDVAYTFEDQDLPRLGVHISTACRSYHTHWVEKKVSGVFKRSVEAVEEEVEEEQDAAYAMMSNYPDRMVIYKLFMHNLKVEKEVTNNDDKVSKAA